VRIFFRARKGVGLKATDKDALIFHTFTNQLRCLNRQVLIFKEIFENNDIAFFMLLLAFQEGIWTPQPSLFTTQSLLNNVKTAPELSNYLGRNWLLSNTPISNISIILSLGIARNWEFSYKYAPCGLSVLLQVLSLWSAFSWDRKWSVSLSGTQKQTAVNRQNGQFP